MTKDCLDKRAEATEKTVTHKIATHWFQ